MAAMVEMHHTGCVTAVRSEIVALIEHALADRPGDWQVSIIGSQANDRWEMKIAGPNAFERAYTLEGSAGEHEPNVIGKLVARMVPGRFSIRIMSPFWSSTPINSGYPSPRFKSSTQR